MDNTISSQTLSDSDINGQPGAGKKNPHVLAPVYIPQTPTRKYVPFAFTDEQGDLRVVGMLWFMSDINQPSLPTPFHSILVSISLSLWPFQLYFIP